MARETVSGMLRPQDGLAAGRTAVLLVNLGTPDGYDYASMRRYLAEFLTDRRVIEWPRLIWYPILYGIVLNRRPQKSGAAYAAIWNRELDESPLRTITRSQAEKLASRLATETLRVDWAMRYGRPSIGERINALQAEGRERVLIVPLYPQYSATTTATVCDKAFEALMKLRNMPSIRISPPYYNHPSYIEALARSVERHLEGLAFTPERLIASYHGIPVSYAKKGDPYPLHCHETSRLLAERLGLPAERLITAFQSRFGPEEWLQPYTDRTIAALAEQGIKDIAVINPGFVADCLETLEEIAIAGAELFHQSGGRNFSHIPCLNDSADGIAAIEDVVRRELCGWIDLPGADTGTAATGKSGR